MNDLALKAYCKYLYLQGKVIDKIREERGDTNFLSIMIILAIVFAIALMFIGFKDKIIPVVEQAFNNFIEPFTQTNKG